MQTIAKKNFLCRVIAPSCEPTLGDLKKKRKKIVVGDITISFSYTKRITSASIEDKVADLHEAFLDPTVDGIICYTGGYRSNTILPYIDMNIITKNYKPLYGYSDITILLNAFYSITGKVFYHGPMYDDFGSVPRTYETCTRRSFIDSWIGDYGYIESDKRIDRYSSRSDCPMRKGKQNVGLQILTKGYGEGTIIGGNLCSINLLQGTTYMPAKNRPYILFLEDDDLCNKYSPFEFVRNLQSLLMSLSSIQGIVFGRMQKYFYRDISRRKTLTEKIPLLTKIPIIINANFGHTYPMITFPIGGTCILNTDNKTSMIQIV